jgi:hypothetical protein
VVRSGCHPEEPYDPLRSIDPDFSRDDAGRRPKDRLEGPGAFHALDVENGAPQGRGGKKLRGGYGRGALCPRPARLRRDGFPSFSTGGRGGPSSSTLQKTARSHALVFARQAGARGGEGWRGRGPGGEGGGGEPFEANAARTRRTATRTGARAPGWRRRKHMATTGRAGGGGGGACGVARTSRSGTASRALQMEKRQPFPRVMRPRRECAGWRGQTRTPVRQEGPVGARTRPARREVGARRSGPRAARVFEQSALREREGGGRRRRPAPPPPSSPPSQRPWEEADARRAISCPPRG